MSHPVRLLLVSALGLGLANPALAAEDDDVPTYEDIQRVAKPTEVADGSEEAYQLDDVVVNATRRRELAYRFIQVALDRRRSDRAEDADLTVCRKVTRAGSHILQTMCATNSTWLWIREQTTRQVLGPMRSAQAPYIAKQGAVYQIKQSYINKLGQEYGRDGDHEGRVRQLMAEDAAERMTDEHGTPAADVARFANAFAAVQALGTADDAALERAIQGHGLGVDEYNRLVERLESSPAFKRRVSLAMEAAAR